MNFSSMGVLVGFMLAAVSGVWAQPAKSPSTLSANQKVVAQKVAAQQAFARFLTLNNQGQLKSVAAKNLVMGEAIRFTQINKLGPISDPDAFVWLDAEHAVTRAQGLNGKVPVIDLYFYLTLSGPTWKVSAMRSLAMTGMIEMMVEEMEQKPKLTQQESEELANAKLTLSVDRDLRLYFAKNRARFGQLLSLATKQPVVAKSYMKQLGLSSISTNNPDVVFLIGGMVDNTVGYLYSPNNKPPQISPEEYIWVEKIADKWYLFRTT